MRTIARRLRNAPRTIAIALAFIVVGGASAQNTIETYAGTGTAGYTGDGGAAASATVDLPSGIAVAGNGDVYFADKNNAVIRKVDAVTGVISTVAGGAAVVIGDGSAATAAWLSGPQRVAVDASGNIFICDTEHHRIRKVTAGSGLISTIAGTGTAGYTGDGGLATSAQLNRPHGIVVGGGTAQAQFGYTTAYGSLGQSTKIQTATQVTLADAATVKSITAYVGNLSVKKARFAVYTDSAGEPGTLIVQTPTTATPDPIGWLTISIHDTALAAGTYWLALSLDSSQQDFAYDSAGGQTRKNGHDAGKDGFQATWSGTTTSNNWRVSIYASYEKTQTDIYVADTDNHCVRKFTEGGNITTIAGTGAAGFSGDGGPATSAEFNSPHAIAIDGDGNLFVTDTGNDRIRKVTSIGTASTVAGTGTAGYSGDGGDPTLATLDGPEGIAIDDWSTTPNVGYETAFGSLTASNSKQTVTQATLSEAAVVTSITAYVGNKSGSSVRFAIYEDSAGEPGALAVETAQGSTAATMQWLTLPVTDTPLPAGTYWLGIGLDNVQQDLAYASTGGATRINSNGTVTNIGFESVWSGSDTSNSWKVSIYATYTKTGFDVYVADTNNHRVRKFEEGATISTVAGTGTAGFSGDGGAATSAQINEPHDVYLNSTDDIFIADRVNHRIRKVDTGTGNISTYGGTGSAGYSGNGGAATAAMMYAPQGVFVDGSDDVFVADTQNHVVRKITDATGVITLVAGTPGESSAMGDGLIATIAVLDAVEEVDLDTVGHLYIACRNQGRIRKVDAGTGVITSIIGTGTEVSPASATDDLLLSAPTSVAVDDDGNVYVADQFNHRIVKFTVAGATYATIAGTTVAGFSGDGGLASLAQLYSPRGVAVDKDGNVFIADSANHRIRRIDGVTGFITTVAGNGTAGYLGDGGSATSARLQNPVRVAADTRGNLYIADHDNHAVRKVDTSGIITTLAGTGTAGYSGDGGDPTLAMLDGPAGIGFKRSGSSYLHLSDTGNHRVRVVDVRINGFRIISWQEVAPQ